MRKIIILLILIPFAVKAQTGTGCSTAIPVYPTTYESYSDYGTKSGEAWFCFIATSTLLQIQIGEPRELTHSPLADIHQLELYSGSCNNLSLMGNATINIHGNNDSLPILVCNNFLVGQTYFVKVNTFQLSSCSHCMSATELCFFSINIQEPINPLLNTCPGDFCSSNMVINGDFEQTPSSPHQVDSYSYSAMDYVTSFSQNSTYFTNEYMVANSASIPFSTNGADHSAGAGNYFFYGDAPSKKEFNDHGPTWIIDAWSQAVNVTQGRSYKFSAFFKNIGIAGGSSAQFQLVVNGTVVLSWTPVGGYDSWKELCGTWVSPTTNSVSLTIQVRGAKSPAGYDFGIDDISFVQDLPIHQTISYTPQIFCAPSTITFTANHSVDNYLWYINNIPWSSNPVLIYVVSAPTTIKLISWMNGASCPRDTVEILVGPDVPNPGFMFAPSSICVGSQVSFVNTTTSASNTFICNWNFGDSSPLVYTNTPVHTYTTPGTFTVSLTTTSLCGSASFSGIVNVIPSYPTYNANCCSENETFDFDETAAGPIVITNPVSSPMVWANQNYKIKGTLTIMPGAALTIVTSDIQFDPNSKIVVSPGAVLTIDQSTLEGLKLCGTMWQGIEVWGNSIKNQTQLQSNGLLYQGKVILKNGSKVVRAHNAVILGRPIGSSFNASFGGGIVDATNTTFDNNGVGVKFGPYYQYVNKCRIQYCTFTSTILPDPGYTTGNLYGYTYTNTNNARYAPANTLGRSSAFVYVQECKYVNIKDNTFDNAEYGVLAINSKINVIDGDNVGGANDFKNMTYGILDANVFSTLYGNRIEKNKFDKIPNLAAVYVVGSSGDRVSDNTINAPLTSPGSIIGMGFSGCQGLYVVDNQINKCLVGIGATATGTQGGLIGFAASGNVFTGCANGTFASGNNQALQIRCNKYDNSNNYIRNWYVSGSMANQGNFPILSDKDPAGNDLGVTSPGIRDELYSTSFFDYYYHVPSTAYPATQPDVSLLNGNTLTTANFINTGYAKNPISCNPIPCQPPCSQLPQLTTSVSQLQAELNSMVVDGGQTAVILSAISTGMDKTQLKSLLLTNSYLSDEVLLAYIASANYTEQQFKEVLLANSPVSETVRPALFAAITGFSTVTATAVRNAQLNYGVRTPAVVRATLASTLQTRQLLINETVYYYVENNDLAAAQTLLAAETTVGAKQILAATYLADGNYSAAATVLNALQPATPEEQYFKDLYLMLNAVYSSGRSFYSLTTTEEQVVRSIATTTSPSTARSNAWALLFAAYGEPIPLEFVTEGNTNRMQTLANDPVEASYQYLGPNYPNPFTNSTVIPYFVPENTSGVLFVYDVNGKLVATKLLIEGGNTVVLDTQYWQAGVYMYTITINGQQQEFRKMILIRQ